MDRLSYDVICGEGNEASQAALFIKKYFEVCDGEKQNYKVMCE